jgi:iron(II)-dependent oxidoreductase
MEPMVGYLTIDSKPPSAKVYLDGMEYLGETPVTHKAIPIGKHSYEVRKDKYKSESSTVEVQEDFTYTFMHELDPKEAQLSVFTRPTNAKIWINEEPRAETTPAKFNLVPGDYTLKFYAKGFLTAEENVVLGPSEEKAIEVALAPGDAPMGMILVAAGKFNMGNNGGAPDERPQREIDVPPFYIDKNEVTNGEFKIIFPNHTFEKGKENYPVCGVSFKRATDYAVAVGKRLPTEVEWEKAARGADGREYPWGMEFNKELCNSEGSGATGPLRVGKYRLGASPFGCLDMAGNVYEWTSSWYQAYEGNTDITKDYGQVFRVLRGGSYKSDRFGVRCARRHFDRMDADSEDYGFRCVKDVASQ